ncbi:MAG: hypothetical protein AAGD10_21240 [Myxococcota bacterium]
MASSKTEPDQRHRRIQRCRLGELVRQGLLTELRAEHQSDRLHQPGLGQYPSNGVQWADARLQNNELVSRAFFAETSKARYLKQSPTLFEELGYTP